MKNYLYLTLLLLLITAYMPACNKPAQAPLTPALALSNVGMQFGQTYNYTHYHAAQAYESGHICFESDTSFIEIINTDTFYYHTKLFYTFNGSYSLSLPFTDTIHSNTAGINYTYNYFQSLPYYLFLGKIIMAWSGYVQDSVHGNSADYAPVAYYLKNFPALALTEYNNAPRLAPPGSYDSTGNYSVSSDIIVFVH